MSEMIWKMIEWIHEYYGSGLYLLLAVAAYAYLFVNEKTLRKKLVYPVFLIAFLLINPILFQYVFSKTLYWRWFWIIPNAYVIAAASVHLIQKMEKRWHRALILLVFIVAVIFNGTNFFLSDASIKTTNLFEVEQETAEVCDVILQKDSDPYCMMTYPLCNRARQYSGDVILYFGRNGEGYITEATELQKQLFSELRSDYPDYELVFQTAEEENCEFVVTLADRPVNEKIYEKHGYQILYQFEKYTVFTNE